MTIYISDIYLRRTGSKELWAKSHYPVIYDTRADVYNHAT